MKMSCSDPRSQELLCEPHSVDRVGDILFDDRQGFRGRLTATTPGPHLHHGGHYIPSATRFLDGFYPWLVEELGLTDTRAG
jgi:hypothetical protein